VHYAIYKPTGKCFAIKSIKLFEKSKREQFKNDLEILSSNKCKNIITFYGAFFIEGYAKLILEYMNLGSLDKILKIIKNKKIKPPCIPENILSKIAKEILSGLYYLHKEKHQIHRDIKPSNVLINTDGIVKLTDFGISCSLESSQNFSNTFVGSRYYMSPERITGNKYNYSSDIWSLGLVIYELATGDEPYKNKNDFITIMQKIMEDSEPRLNSNFFSKEFCDFIEKTLKKEPEKRDSIDQLLKHEWIIKYDNGNDNNSTISEWLAQFYDISYSK